MLKAAINYKLLWDVDMNVEDFSQRFLDAWFGPAAKDMKKYYYSFREWSEQLKNGSGYNGDMCSTDLNAKHYPKDKLDEWMTDIENAYKSIESLQTTNKKQYKTILDHINAESIAVRFHLIQYHGTKYSPDVLREMKLQFKADAIEWGFTKYAELHDIEYLWQGWGV